MSQDHTVLGHFLLSAEERGLTDMKWNTEALDRFLEEKIAERKLPGVAVCIRGPEGVLFSKGYGHRDGAGLLPVDGDTIFGVASMSKSMTALALAMLEEEGKLSLEDPVVRYFPTFQVPGNARDEVTLRHLAMHTSGIPPMEPLEWSIAMNTPGRDSKWARALQASAPNAMSTIQEVIDYIAQGRYPTLGAPGEIMSYSNEGYAILSYVVDQAAGIPLEQFLQERVFRPLGMERSVMDIAGEEAKVLAEGNISALFDLDDEGQLYWDEVWSALPPFRGSACVRSTAHDMARYYQCLSNGGVLDGVQCLPAGAVEKLAGPAFPTQEKAFYCLGLNKRLLDGHVYCEHSGGLHGVSSEGGYLQGENYGFAVLCNQGEVDVTDLLWALYNAVTGRPLEADHRWLHPTGGTFSQPELLTGHYVCYEGVPVHWTISCQDGALSVDQDGAKRRLLWCGGTWFQQLDEEGQVVGRCRFHIRNGQAWGVQVYTRVYQREDYEKETQP